MQPKEWETAAQPAQGRQGCTHVPENKKSRCAVLGLPKAGKRGSNPKYYSDFLKIKTRLDAMQDVGCRFASRTK